MAYYKLYTDKQETFECEVSVKNASLKNSIARLVLESDGLNLVFNGTLDGEKCTVPIKKLKGILDENTKGKMHLEIIVENTYFKPWESDFEVEEHTSVKVAVKEQKESPKPIVEVRVSHSEKPKISKPAQDIVSICESSKITSKNYRSDKKSDFKKTVKQYFTENKNHLPKMTSILNEVVSQLR
jgi:hypothetical protein